MSLILSNWRTSLGGAILIAIAALHQFFGVNVPGFSMDVGAALTAGLALILAQDAGKSAS